MALVVALAVAGLAPLPVLRVVRSNLARGWSGQVNYVAITSEPSRSLHSVHGWAPSVSRLEQILGVTIACGSESTTSITAGLVGVLCRDSESH